MRRHVIVLVFTYFLVAGTRAIVADEGGKEAKELDGSWLVESVVRDPKEKGDDEGKDFRIFVSGNSVVVKAAEKDKTLGKLVINIDATKKPKTIDVTPEGETDTTLGIYELDGDSLKICWGPLETKRRPTEFSSKPGSQQSVVTLKRKKR